MSKQRLGADCEWHDSCVGNLQQEQVAPREGPASGKVPWRPSGERIQRNAKHFYNSRSEGGARKREGSLEAKRRAYSKKCDAFLQKQRHRRGLRMGRDATDCKWLTKITLRYQMLAMATY